MYENVINKVLEKIGTKYVSFLSDFFHESIIHKVALITLIDDRTLLTQIRTCVGENELIPLIKGKVLPLQMEYIMFNPNITMEVIANHPEINWDYTNISENPNLSGAFICNSERKRERFYPRYSISCNPCISMTDIRTYHMHINWDWRGVSRNPNLTMDVVESFSRKDWNWDVLSRHKLLTMGIVERLPDKSWNWKDISSHPNITMDNIEGNPQFPWNWEYISLNPNITIEFVSKHPNEQWDLENLAKNKNIDIKKFLQKFGFSLTPMIMHNLSTNHSLTIDIVNKFRLCEWNWKGISSNPNISMKMIEDNLDKPWSAVGLSQNPNLTYDFIIKHPEIQFEWASVSLYCKFTSEQLDKLIEKYPGKFSMSYISEKKYINDDFINKHIDKLFPSSIQFNPKMTLKTIIKHRDKNWHWMSFSKVILKERSSEIIYEMLDI